MSIGTQVQGGTRIYGKLQGMMIECEVQGLEYRVEVRLGWRQAKALCVMQCVVVCCSVL